MGKTIFLALGGVLLALSCCASSNDGLEIYQGSYIEIAFNDVRLLRLTPSSAPSIDRGRSDFLVRINCLGGQDCNQKINSILRIAAKRSPYSGDCKTVYAKLKIVNRLSLYDESAADEVNVYEFDGSGKCMSFNGKNFKLVESIFGVLNTHSIVEY